MIFRVTPYKLSMILFIIFLISIIRQNWLLFIIVMLAKLFLLYFYRLPTIKLHNINKDSELITAPSYGVIDNITYTDDNIRIKMILNIFDVHAQYIPYGGEILLQEYIPGRFELVDLDSKSNEQNRILLKTKNGLIEVIQYAGYFTRRITSFVKKGDIKKKGDLYGFISFGSRVDMIVPRNSVKIDIKIGQKMKGPMSVIGTWNTI